MLRSMLLLQRCITEVSAGNHTVHACCGVLFGGVCMHAFACCLGLF
jgi:hypothetical protein